MKTCSELRRHALSGETMGTRYSAVFFASTAIDESIIGAALFAAADKVGLVAVDHDFGSARAGVVIRTHRHAVGAGRHDCQQIARRNRQRTIVAKEITGFADRADDFPVTR